MKFHRLRVLAIKKETEGAVSVAFDVPYELYDTFNYKPGQYLTLKFNLNGEEARRSYSLCSTPVLEEALKIGVKRVEGGLVSNHINDNLKVGDEVEVMAPDGRFFANVDAKNYKTYYLFAAGSGITPILSILRTVVITEKKSLVHMIYGNRNQDSVMFHDELQKLQTQFPDRLALVHTFSHPKSSWSDLWGNTKKVYHHGRIDPETVKWFIDEYPPYAQDAEYYICGPGTMIENTKKALQSIDVPNGRIFTESFGGNSENDHVQGVENAQLIATLGGQTVELKVPKGKTILRTLVDDGKEPPFSCEGGVCGTCVCKIRSGQVHMKNNLALDEDEVKAGYILSCQSIPLTEKVEIVYE